MTNVKIDPETAKLLEAHALLFNVFDVYII